MVKISGYIAKPELPVRKVLTNISLSTGVYMRHPYFHKAVMEAYEQLIPVGEQVSYFIYFEVDPANIDVNIHPTKTEIKFENEQAIWQILSASVRSRWASSAPFLPLISIRKICRIFLHLSRTCLLHLRRFIIIRISIRSKYLPVEVAADHIAVRRWNGKDCMWIDQGK